MIFAPDSRYPSDPWALHRAHDLRVRDLRAARDFARRELAYYGPCAARDALLRTIAAIDRELAKRGR